MGFGNFGNAWREKAFYVDPDERLHVADASHSQAQKDPNATWYAPADVDDQADFLYDGDAVVGDWVTDGPGLVFDVTPTDHRDGGEFRAFTSDAEAAAVNAAVGNDDRGASVQDSYAPPLVQDYTTRYASNRIEGTPYAGVSPVALQRGLNANPENNPEGFRRGFVEQFFVDRKFQIGERFHDRRLLTPNLATVETDQAAVPGTSGSPFTTLARGMSTIAQRPMIRRNPPTISESVTDDGAYQTYDDQPSDWVTG